jgi:serine/threonine-protein kinase OSR1/STK39
MTSSNSIHENLKSQTPNVPQDFPTKASAYSLDAPIGYGAFATVYKAHVMEAPRKGQNVAIKVIDLEVLEGTTFDDIRRELQIMRMCVHPNVLTYYVAFPADTMMWLVMPLVAGGSCQNVIKEIRRLHGTSIRSEGAIAYILRETASALNYLHHSQQIHRDLKAGNILLDLDGHVYLSDFGVSASMRDSKVRQTFVGTPCWMAPEVLEQKKGYDYKADIWSLGISALELANGAAPYHNYHPLKVMKNIIEQPPPVLSKSAGWSNDFVKFVADCLQKDPTERPPIDVLLAKHKSFFDKANRDEVVKILSQLPPVEQREPTKPPGYQSPRAEASKPQGLSGEWNFNTDEKDENADFAGIGESES